jgi:GAF domain-containing protein
MVGDNGMVQLFGVAHVAAEKVALAWELNRRYPPDPHASSGVYEVIRTGRPEWSPTISEEMLAKATRDAEHLRIVRELGLRSSVTVPLKARGRVLGALQLISAESSRTFSAADVSLFEQLAERAALAVDNARLYREAQVSLRRKEEEQRISETLHRMGLSLASELDPVRLIKSVTEAGVSLTGASLAPSSRSAWRRTESPPGSPRCPCRGAPPCSRLPSAASPRCCSTT